MYVSNLGLELATVVSVVVIWDYFANEGTGPCLRRGVETAFSVPEIDVPFPNCVSGKDSTVALGDGLAPAPK